MGRSRYNLAENVLNNTMITTPTLRDSLSEVLGVRSGEPTSPVENACDQEPKVTIEAK